MGATLPEDRDHESQRAVEDIDELVSSPTRVTILRELAEYGTLHRDDLREVVTATRTTLTRNLETLQDLGWISNSGSQYGINACGKLVVEELETLLERTLLANRLQTVLQWIPETSIDIDIRQFQDAEILEPEPGNPYAMIDRHIDLVRNATQCRALLRVTGLHATEAGHEMVVENRGRAELVVTPDVVHTFRSTPRFDRLITEMLDTGRLEVFQSDSPIPYSLVLLDETVHLVADEDGAPRAIIETDAPAVRSWAEGKLLAYKHRSQSVSI